MEVEGACETSVAIYQAARRHVQKYSNVHIHRCDKVTSHKRE